MKKCSLCGVLFERCNDEDENTEKNRYCSCCRSDPFRRILWRIHEVIGVSSYTEQEIDILRRQLAIAVETMGRWEDGLRDVMNAYDNEAVSIATAYSRAKRFNDDLGKCITEVLADIEAVKR